MRATAERSAPSETTPARRVAALVLPALLIELAEPRLQEDSKADAATEGRVPASRARRPRLPIAVVLDAPPTNGVATPEAVGATSVLSAVNDIARKLGVREGQTVAEARAFSSRLVVRQVARASLEQGLSRVAEIALGFGPVVAFSAPDTVWVDVTGIAHLFGGEVGLAAELSGRVREAGHRVRLAISDGPRLAQAFARYGELNAEGLCLVPTPRTREKLASLPLRALSLPAELESWFIRLGVLTVADLLALPRGALGGRLGEHTASVLELAEGRDSSPLARYEPPRCLVESTSWEEPVDGREPLLFVLRGLVSRISARLQGRGEAAQSLVLRILADPVLARFRGIPRETTLEFTLPKPLHREQELVRIVSSRLERLELGAPSVELRLEVPKLTEALPRQLELGSLLMGAKSDALDELPIVLAELASDIGVERVGVLKMLDSHRPEQTSKLVPLAKTSLERPRKKRPRGQLATAAPVGLPPVVGRLTRLLPTPQPFDAPLRAGATVLFDHRLYKIESVRFLHRLEAVEWWSRAVHRDYVRVVLHNEEGFLEALVFVDRETGERYLQGVLD